MVTVQYMRIYQVQLTARIKHGGMKFEELRPDSKGHITGSTGYKRRLTSRNGCHVISMKQLSEILYLVTVFRTSQSRNNFQSMCLNVNDIVSQ